MVAAGIGLAVAVGVTGCGQVQKLSAKDKVTDALSGFEDAKSATFTVSLDTTAADMVALSKAAGDPMSAADQKTLAKVLAGDVVLQVEAADGKTFGDSAKAGTDAAGSADLSTLLGDPAKLSEMLKQQGSFSMSVRQSGTGLVDLRSVDGVIYAKADVKKILTLAGESPTALDQQLGSLPPSMSSLAKAAKGEWVSLDLAEAAAAAKDSGLLDSLPTPSASPTVDAAKVQKLITDLKAAYQQKATITELGEDGDRGDGYRLGAPAKQVADAVSADLIALVGKDGEAEVKKAINQIPDKNFSIDMWVKDDKLTAVSLDLKQFVDEPVAGKKMAIDIDIALDSGKVEAPAGASKIDVKGLLSQLPAGGLSGLAETSGSSASGSGSATGTVPEISDAQMDQLKKQTGLSEKEIRKLMESQATQ